MAVAAFLNGTITNWRLDDLLYNVRTEDPLCTELRDQTWFTYDDIARYRNEGKRKLSEPIAAMLSRWEMLLRSEAEWNQIVPEAPVHLTAIGRFFAIRAAPLRKFDKNLFWPASNENHWNQLATSHSKQS